MSNIEKYFRRELEWEQAARRRREAIDFALILLILFNLLLIYMAAR